MKRTNLILVFISSILFVACGDKTSTSNNPSNSENKIEENNTIAESSAKGTEKLNRLIDGFNSFSSIMYTSYDDYVESFGNDQEKFTKHQNWYNGARVHENALKTLNKLNETTEITVYPELDSLIIAYQNSALKLSKVLNESYSYYDMKDYESDNFAKAQEYHKPTLNAFNNFFVIDRELQQKSNSIQSALELVYLKKLKDEGQTLNYLVGMAINTSEKMLKETQADEYEKLNTADLEKAQENVRTIFDELTQYKLDKTEEFNQDHNMSWFYSAFKDFTKSSKVLCNRKRENRPFSTGEKMNLNPSSGWMVKGSTYKVLKDYNTLINRYNSMIK